MRRRILLIVAAVIVSCAARGIAQGPIGGPPGFGPPQGRFMPPNPLASLLAAPEVQAEIKCTSEQKQKISQLLSQFDEQQQKLFAAFNPQELRDLEPEQRDARFSEMRQKMDGINQQLRTQIDECLPPSQRDRLAQLIRQRAGIAALLEDANRLQLSAEQNEKLRDLQDDRPPFLISDEDRRKESDAIAAILTANQRQQWETLTGPAFQFPQSVMRPPMPGFGGRGGPMQQERKLVKQFDKDNDGHLNRAERDAARESIAAAPRRGPGPRGPGASRREPPQPGAPLAPADVPTSTAPLYSLEPPLRTLFLNFADQDWETEMAAFYKSDVEVPATLTVDGREYRDVGVHFRGMSSFFAVGAGYKRSLNLTLDFFDSQQRLYGCKTLNLLNAHEDPSFLHTVLYFYIARHYIPAPRANFVRLAINDEDWGLYANVQQFNKEFVVEHFDTTDGARWKVPGSPGGRGGLEYIGDDVAPYKRIYEMKSKEDDRDWQSLIGLCKTLNQTPLDELESALEPILDIDGALWFLALENSLINSDGYWIRASDYSIYRDVYGKFHILPHDANETFQAPMGPGAGPGGRRGGERRGNPIELDPLVGLNDASKPLRSRLLSVPSLRQRYLRHVRTIATDWLAWEKLDEVVAPLVDMIEPMIATDTRKLHSLEEFKRAVSATDDGNPSERRGATSLRRFAETRRNYLLNYPAIKELAD